MDRDHATVDRPFRDTIGTKCGAVATEVPRGIARKHRGHKQKNKTVPSSVARDEHSTNPDLPFAWYFAPGPVRWWSGFDGFMQVLKARGNLANVRVAFHPGQQSGLEPRCKRVQGFCNFQRL